MATSEQNPIPNLKGQLEFIKKTLSALRSKLEEDDTEFDNKLAELASECEEKTDDALESVTLISTQLDELEVEITDIQQQPKEEYMQGYGDIYYSAPNLIDGQIMEALAKCFERGRNQELLSTLEFIANG